MRKTDKKTNAPSLGKHNDIVQSHKDIELKKEHCQLMFNNGFCKNYTRPGMNINEYVKIF